MKFRRMNIATNEQTYVQRSRRLLVKHGARSTRSTRSTEHMGYGAVEKRKSVIIHCLLLQIFVIINKVFSRFTRWGSKVLLKNTYAN